MKRSRRKEKKSLSERMKIGVCGGEGEGEVNGGGGRVGEGGSERVPRARGGRERSVAKYKMEDGKQIASRLLCSVCTCVCVCALTNAKP